MPRTFPPWLTVRARPTGSLPPTAFTARYGVLCAAVSFAFAISGPTLSWLTGNLRGTGASTLAVPLNGSFSTFGQIIGTFISHSHVPPLYFSMVRYSCIRDSSVPVRSCVEHD